MFPSFPLTTNGKAIADAAPTALPINNRRPAFPFPVVVFAPLDKPFKSETKSCNPPNGQIRLHHKPGQIHCIISNNRSPAPEIKIEYSETWTKELKNPLKIATGSRKINSGKPNIAPVKEQIANNLPINGILLIECLLAILFRFGMLSSRQPVGHRYLQKNRFLNQVAIRITNPIPFRNTRDLRANTEFSIINGLNQLVTPEILPQPKGIASRIAIAREMYLMVFLLAEINILGK